MAGAVEADNRLPPPAGLLLDRTRTLDFRFEGRSYRGFAGDTIASALAANGVWLISRSFKYHRPRGVLTMAGQDANALVQLPGEPNVPADRVPLAAGMEVAGQHYRGSLEHDRDAWIGRIARFLPVGFYYRAFFRPRGAWKFWEPVVRRQAGLGRVDPAARSDAYDKASAFCDVVVVGGGPAGLAAALEAAHAGAEVLLVEENPLPGGSLAYARFDPAGDRAARLREELTDAVLQDTRIEVLSGAVCNAWYADNYLPVIRGQRLYKVRARELVMASGSIEQPAVFRNNDLPGVMQGSAAQRLIRLYGVRPGRRAVVLTANADGYGVALDLADAGVEVAAVVDLRPEVAAEPLSGAARERGLRIVAGHAVYEALPGPGGRHLAGAQVRRITGPGACAPRGELIGCDLLCMSPGYTPAYQLPLQAGGHLDYDDVGAAFSIRNLPARVALAGSVNGALDLCTAISDGRRAGWSAARALGLDAGERPSSPAAERALQLEPEPEETRLDLSTPANHPWPIFPHPRGKDFVDFDEDLQVADILDAVAAGYEHIELVKRFSTVGMGPSQGRHSALNTARLVARATGRSVAQTGVTTARPPVSPEKLAQIAGRSFAPERHTPMHHRHVEAGAHLLVAGPWLRPGWYGPPGERLHCVRQECAAVRGGAGLIDVSTLGGIEVRGPDAAAFLGRMYTTGFRRHRVGHARYVVMTSEYGTVIDDGVACRLHERHFYVTATTTGVDAVYRNMLQWNAQWRLDVDVANVSAAWCGVNVAGPRARDVLSDLCRDVDLSPDAFPYLGVREGTVAGIPVRMLRVGFVGELGYELHAPAGCGEALWDALVERGAAFGLTPFGVEAQRLLRLEKGHIIIGQDTDSLSHPHELGLAWAISRRKPFFVGGRSIEAIMERPPRRALAGFAIDDPRAPVPEESHLVLRGEEITGRVTSCAFSPTLGRTIGLAYVAPDQSAPGARLHIRSRGGVMVEGEVVQVPFYDPEGERQKT